MLSSHTIKFNLIIGVGNHKNNTTSTQTEANIFFSFFHFWFFWIFFYVTIRDHSDSLSAMVGSTLPREWVWSNRYIVTVENENK